VPAAPGRDGVGAMGLELSGLVSPWERACEFCEPLAILATISPVAFTASTSISWSMPAMVAALTVSLIGASVGSSSVAAPVTRAPRAR